MTNKLADNLAYPPRALRAERAAAYLSMSTAMFLKLVDEGRLPKPKRLGGQLMEKTTATLDYNPLISGNCR